MQQPLLNSFKKNLRTVSTLLLRQSCHAFSWPGIHYGAEVSLKLTATILRFLSAGIIGLCNHAPPPFLNACYGEYQLLIYPLSTEPYTLLCRMRAEDSSMN